MYIVRCLCLENFHDQKFQVKLHTIKLLLHDWEVNTGNIQFEAGSIGPGAVRDNTEADQIFPILPYPKECIYCMTYIQMY